MNKKAPGRNGGRTPQRVRTAGKAALACLLLALAAAPLASRAADPPDPQRYQKVLKDREEVLKMLRAATQFKEEDTPRFPKPWPRSRRSPACRCANRTAGPI